MTNRHKVFISFHHANDQLYKDKFEKLFSGKFDIMVSKAVGDDEIDTNLPAEAIRQTIRDRYIRDSTVTVVLIGTETWQRKHVDWEISSTIRDTKLNPRGGLIGIILPSYPGFAKNEYNSKTIPPRLDDNIDCGFSKIYKWSDDPEKVQKWIHDAFVNRDQTTPDNTRALFGKNRTGAEWQ